MAYTAWYGMFTFIWSWSERSCVVPAGGLKSRTAGLFLAPVYRGAGACAPRQDILYESCHNSMVLAKAWCLQLVWSLFLVFCTMQFMTVMPPSCLSWLPSADIEGKGTNSMEDMKGLATTWDVEASHGVLSGNLGLATEALCLQKTPMTLAQFLDQVSHLGASYPPPANQQIRLLALALTGALTPLESQCKHSGSGAVCDNRLPFDPLTRFCGNDWPTAGQTMVGLVRLRNVADVLWQVIVHAIPGDFAELGVWKGGSCIFAKAILDMMKEKRSVHVFDAFDALPSYGDVANFIAVPEEAVRFGFQLYNVFDSKIIFYKGLFKDTLPGFYTNHTHDKMQLAVLRVDGNFYDSYQDTLYYLYGFVSVGGFVIFDDVYSHPPAMQAWKEFKEDHALPEDLIRIDMHSGYFQKTRSVSIDFTKMRRTHTRV